MPIKAALFDLDMTLVDSSAVEIYRRNKLWGQVRAEIGRVKPFGISSGPSPHELPQQMQRQGLRVGVVTTSPRWYAEHILKEFGVTPDLLVTYEDTDEHKPDPAPIEFALTRLGVRPEEAIHVGDDVLDTEAAYHASVFSIGAGWCLNGSGSSAIAEHAPEVLLWKPSLLLNLPELGRLTYLGEVAAQNGTLKWHLGSTLWWRTEGRTVQCLGRYMKGEDPRHAHHRWTAILLQNKNDDQHSVVLGQALANYLNYTSFNPDYVVSVPPKPDQRNRFTALMAACRPLLMKSVALEPDGLTCLEAIPGYKSMGYVARRAAVRGKYRTSRRWSGKVVLLDDVHTSGATSEECASVLLDSGAAEVRTVAFGLNQKAMEKMFCPSCGRPMKVRTERATGDRFWGCTGYPDQCRRTVSM